MRLGQLTNRPPSWELTRVSFQLDALSQKALEILSLTRSKMNMLAPISRLPQEILTLIPDFCHGPGRGKIPIVLSHVCRAWRETFVSRASLWTDFQCVDAEKTRVYLERSKTSSISLWLQRPQGFFPSDPFFEIAPHIPSRLKSLSVTTTPNYLQDITENFIHPTPLIETLTIEALTINGPDLNPVLTTALFDGDLSLLRELHLRSVRTELPWRSMNNLTSFSLSHMTRPAVSVGQILDFFESAPRLREVELISATPTVHTQNGRLLSLTHLRKLSISGGQSPSILLDYLVIPVGAKMSVESPRSRFDDHLPKSLDNLRNLSNFTKISLFFKDFHASVRFTGPNGEVTFASSFGFDAVRSVPQILARFDTSKTRRMEIINGYPITNELCEALMPMTNLRTLMISRCKDTLPFLHCLSFGLSESSWTVVCPKLKKLVFRTSDRFEMGVMVNGAAVRARREAPLKLVKIVSCPGPVSIRLVAELLKHVSRVETGVWEGGEADYFSDDSDFSEDGDEGG